MNRSKRSICRSKIRKERLLKAILPGIILIGYIISIGTFSAGSSSKYPSLSWISWGIAAVVLLCLCIWIVRAGNPRRTSFAKAILHFGEQRDLEAQMEEIDEDLAEPVFRGTGIQIGRQWIVAGFYFAKAIPLEHITGVFLIESHDKANNFYLRFLDDDQMAWTFLIGFESPARKAYDYLLSLCPWLIRGSQQDYEALLSLPPAELDLRVAKAKEERYDFYYLNPQAKQFSNAALGRLQAKGRPSHPRLIFPLSSTLMMGFAQSMGTAKRTIPSQIVSILCVAVLAFLAVLFAIGGVSLFYSAVQEREIGLIAISLVMFLMFYLLFHVALGIGYAAFGKPIDRKGISGELADIEKTIFCGKEDNRPSKEDLWALGFAAPIRAKDKDWCDRFESRFSDDPAQVRKNLKTYWGITGPASLRGMFQRLFQGMHAQSYDPLLSALGKESQGRADYFQNTCGVPAKTAQGLANLFQTLTNQFADYGLALPRKTVYAWDLVRAANLALIGYEVGYLPLDEVREVMRTTGELANLAYHDWNSFAGAFVFGRRLWQFYGMDPGDDPAVLQDIHDVKWVAVLVGSPRSFYNVVPFSACAGKIPADQLPARYSV